MERCFNKIESASTYVSSIEPQKLSAVINREVFCDFYHPKQGIYCRRYVNTCCKMDFFYYNSNYFFYLLDFEFCVLSTTKKQKLVMTKFAVVLFAPKAIHSTMMTLIELWMNHSADWHVKNAFDTMAGKRFGRVDLICSAFDSFGSVKNLSTAEWSASIRWTHDMESSTCYWTKLQ